MTEKQNRNRQRCLKCSYYKMNRCPLMLDSDVFNLDVCILEIFHNKKYAPDSPESFMFKTAPVIFLSYLTFKRKNILPKVGDKVLTLHSGFYGYAGVIRTVVEIKETQDNKDFVIEVEDSNGQRSISYVEHWYNDFFVLDDNN